MGRLMPKLSANLGFLWTDLPLPDAIRAAAAAGFDAVECHFPYAVPVADVRAALAETGLPMLGLNTERGDVAAGDFGLAAMPGREAEAIALIDQAVDYAAAIGCGAVHVMAGKSGGGDAAEAAYRSALTHACQRAAPHGITILIEPINHYDAPGYHLSTVEHGAAIIEALGQGNLKLMFDCYHTQIMQGDLTRRLTKHLGVVGHIQIAAVPDRGAPDHGEVDYREMLRTFDALGWGGHIGAEYKPGGPTGDTLGWMKG
ncbi:MAG: hydroxypyruvate isomerase [Paracoccaceae bacterium]|jgi:hydroxypyruvate isomerase